MTVACDVLKPSLWQSLCQSRNCKVDSLTWSDSCQRDDVNKLLFDSRTNERQNCAALCGDILYWHNSIFVNHLHVMLVDFGPKWKRYRPNVLLYRPLTDHIWNFTDHVTNRVTDHITDHIHVLTSSTCSPTNSRWIRAVPFSSQASWTVNIPPVHVSKNRKCKPARFQQHRQLGNRTYCVSC